jgi:beta-glucanase (GH16 family)
MKSLTFLFAALCLLMSASCGSDDKPAITTDPTVNPPAMYKIGDHLQPIDSLVLVWADEFNTGEMVNTADWSYESGYVRNNEIQYYTTARPENCTLRDGMLVFTGRREATLYEGAEFTSASIITNKKHSWKYGRFEIRAKLPSGNGPWPAFWMKGDSQNTGDGWPKCGEIDIMEYASKDPNTMVHNIIFGSGSTNGGNNKTTPAEGTYTQWTAKPSGTYNADFRVYSLDWNNRQITFAIDNVVTHAVDITRFSPNPFNQPFSILLNLSLGAAEDRTMGGKLDPSCLPVEFVVDYVRVYKLN